MKIINDIVEWLQEHGEKQVGSITASGQDEPWQPWTAELQSYPQCDRLYVGYYCESECDFDPDPIITIDMYHDKMVVRMDTLVGRVPCDKEYLESFLTLIYERHLKPQADTVSAGK